VTNARLRGWSALDYKAILFSDICVRGDYSSKSFFHLFCSNSANISVYKRREQGNSSTFAIGLAVASLGGGRPPRVTPFRGVTPEGKNFAAEFAKKLEQWTNEVGQVKKGAG